MLAIMPASANAAATTRSNVWIDPEGLSGDASATASAAAVVPGADMDFVVGRASATETGRAAGWEAGASVAEGSGQRETDVACEALLFCELAPSGALP